MRTEVKKKKPRVVKVIGSQAILHAAVVSLPISR